jgi:hypothetical protein
VHDFGRRIANRTPGAEIVGELSPNRLHRHAISPDPSNFVDPAEQLSSINCGCGDPIVQFGSHPIGNWNRSNVASLADQIS